MRSWEGCHYGRNGNGSPRLVLETWGSGTFTTNDFPSQARAERAGTLIAEYPSILSVNLSLSF